MTIICLLPLLMNCHQTRRFVAIRTAHIAEYQTKTIRGKNNELFFFFINEKTLGG